MPARVALHPYLGLFAVFNMGFAAAVGALSYFAGLEPKLGSVVVMMAAAATGARFAHVEQRLLSRAERWRMIAWSFLISLVLQAAVLAIVVAAMLWLDPETNAMIQQALQEIAKVPVLVWVGAAGVYVLLTFVILYLGYGFLARMWFKAMQGGGRKNS